MVSQQNRLQATTARKSALAGWERCSRWVGGDGSQPQKTSKGEIGEASKNPQHLPPIPQIHNDAPHLLYLVPPGVCRFQCLGRGSSKAPGYIDVGIRT
eukprot:scaffold311_cov98-Cylindrotheca_fusiformis.AAC.2